MTLVTPGDAQQVYGTTLKNRALYQPVFIPDGAPSGTESVAFEFVSVDTAHYQSFKTNYGNGSNSGLYVKSLEQFGGNFIFDSPQMTIQSVKNSMEKYQNIAIKLVLYTNTTGLADGRNYIIGGVANVTDGGASNTVYFSENSGSRWTPGLRVYNIPADVWVGNRLQIATFTAFVTVGVDQYPCSNAMGFVGIAPQ